MKTILIRPDKISEDWSKVRKASGVAAVFGNWSYRLPHTLDILGKDVTVCAQSGRPKLIADGKVAAHFSLGKSSVNARISGLELTSHDPYKERPHGFMVHGCGAHVFDVWGNDLYYFFNFTATSKNTLIENCLNSGGIDGYFAYVKGKNQTIQACTSNRALAGFVRTNECDGLTIENCESFGVGGDSDVSFFVGRVQLQFVSNVRIVNLKLHRALLTTGPLWNIDGWNQRSSDANFFARRTKNVVVDNLQLDGGGWIEIRPGSENVKINTVGGSSPTVKYPKPDWSLPKSVAAKLAKPKDVWINGKKVR